MTYTVERLHACTGENRQAIFRLTFEVNYIPELNVWRHFLAKREELQTVPFNIPFGVQPALALDNSSICIEG